jgi:hypothetical protein
MSHRRSTSGGAAELAIEYPALQRILARQMFTQDGRKYVRGSQRDRCDFAYLEHPVIGAESDRLRVQAHFSGRTATNLFGFCLGVGDAFELIISAVPYFHDGSIGFRAVRVESVGRDGFYIRRVRAAMAQTLSTQFQYPIQEDARRLLEEKRAEAPYVQRLRHFRVSQIRVTSQALVLTLDFALIVQ